MLETYAFPPHLDMAYAGPARGLEMQRAEYGYEGMSDAARIIDVGNVGGRP